MIFFYYVNLLKGLLLYYLDILLHELIRHFDIKLENTLNILLNDKQDFTRGW